MLRLCLCVFRYLYYVFYPRCFTWYSRWLLYFNEWSGTVIKRKQERFPTQKNTCKDRTLGFTTSISSSLSSSTCSSGGANGVDVSPSSKAEVDTPSLPFGVVGVVRILNSRGTKKRSQVEAWTWVFKGLSRKYVTPKSRFFYHPPPGRNAIELVARSYVTLAVYHPTPPVTLTPQRL